MMTRFSIIVLILILFNDFRLAGQTCCSGGVPTSSNLGLPTSSKNTLQFRFNYDLNTLNTQQTGREKSTTPQSFRRTHTAMMQVGYSFTNKFSLDVFLPFVRQERRSNVNNTGETTSGIGDAVFLLKYKLWSNDDNSTVFTIGVAPELPTGRTDFKNQFGNVLLADLQPGSGSIDGLLWSQFSTILNFRPSLNWLTQASYKRNGQNENFGFGNTETTYQFGNEFQLVTGLSDRIILGKSLFDPALLLRYRRTFSDKSKPNTTLQDLTEVPSTGGSWVFISPSMTYWFSQDWSMTAGIEFPLFANIEGTQVTPTSRVNVGVFYRLIFKQKNEVLQDFLTPEKF